MLKFFPYLRNRRRRPTISQESANVHGRTSDHEIELIGQSQLFDANWYSERYRVSADAAVAHYISEGAACGYAPHPLFDSDFYLSKINGLGGAQTPLGHFVLTEGSVQATPHPLFDTDWYAAKYPAAASRDRIPFRDFLLRGAVAGLWPHPLFDTDWYYQQDTTIAPGGINPLTHFVEIGARHGLDPNPFFDVKWYSRTNAEAVGNANPLVHYVQEGWCNGLRPSPLVDFEFYRQRFDGVPDDDLQALTLLVTRDRNEYLAAYNRYRGLLPAMTSAVTEVGAITSQPETAASEPEPARSRPAPVSGAPHAVQSEEIADPIATLLARMAHGLRVVQVGYGNEQQTLSRAVAACDGGAIDFRIVGSNIPHRAAQQLATATAHRRAADCGTGFVLRKSRPASRKVALPPAALRQTHADGLVLKASLFDRDLRNQLGRADLLVAPDDLSKQRNPLALLRRLAYLTREYVVFQSTVVTGFEYKFHGKLVRFTDADLWSAVSLEPEQNAAIELYLHDRGIVLEQFERMRSGLHWELALKENGCWWFLGHGAITELAERADLEIVHLTEIRDGLARLYLVRRRERLNEPAGLHYCT